MNFLSIMNHIFIHIYNDFCHTVISPHFYFVMINIKLSYFHWTSLRFHCTSFLELLLQCWLFQSLTPLPSPTPSRWVMLRQEEPLCFPRSMWRCGPRKAPLPSGTTCTQVARGMSWHGMLLVQCLWAPNGVRILLRAKLPFQVTLFDWS